MGHHHIEAGDPRYDGFRMSEISLYLSVDPVGDQEGVIDGEQLTRWAIAHQPDLALLLPPGPLMAGDPRRVEQLRPVVAAFAAAKNITIKCVRFSGREEVETYR